MRSRMMFSVHVLLAFLGPAAGVTIAQAIDPSTPGVYLLVEVNEKSLPSASTTRASEGRHCEDEALGGAMLLDTTGRWSALVTEREICTNRDGSRTAADEKSEIFIGSYETSGDHITLHDETLGLGNVEGSLTGGILVLTQVGEIDYQGQTTKWVFRKADP